MDLNRVESGIEQEMGSQVTSIKLDETESKESLLSLEADELEDETKFGHDFLADDLDDDDESEVVLMEREELSSEEKVRLMATIADAVRAEDIQALDLRELTIISDYFLICTGKSSIQLRAISDRIEERLRERGYRKLRVEGYQDATWILMDYGDVVVHIMAAEQRSFYSLEELWKDAPLLELELVAD